MTATPAQEDPIGHADRVGAANNDANNIVPSPDLRASAQLESQVLSRINDSKFAGILTPQFKEMLASKIRGDNRAEGILGNKVEPEKMNQMLDELEKLKAKGLTDEHIQAIFIAGFVNGDMKGGGGVSGVLHFLNNTDNAKYVKADGFDTMKRLLEDSYKRSIRYVTEYAGLLRVDIPRALDKIYTGEEKYKGGVLREWSKMIYDEDAQVIGGSLSASEAWGADPAYANSLGYFRTGKKVPLRVLAVTSLVDASGEPGSDFVVAGGRADNRGAPVGALFGGRVIEVHRNPAEFHKEKGQPGRGSGNRVIVRVPVFENGQYIGNADMLYAHFDDVVVAVGDEVGSDQLIGTQGRTGSTTGAHVSLDVYDENGAGSTSRAARTLLRQMRARIQRGS